MLGQHADGAGVWGVLAARCHDLSAVEAVSTHTHTRTHGWRFHVSPPRPRLRCAGPSRRRQPSLPRAVCRSAASVTDVSNQNTLHRVVACATPPAAVCFCVPVCLSVCLSLFVCLSLSVCHCLSVIVCLSLSVCVCFVFCANADGTFFSVLLFRSSFTRHPSIGKTPSS